VAVLPYAAEAHVPEGAFVLVSDSPLLALYALVAAPALAPTVPAEAHADRERDE
jgi:hypothetical protein